MKVDVGIEVMTKAFNILWGKKREIVERTSKMQIRIF